MSDDKKSETSKGGIGLCGGLFLLFVYLKLTGQIAWSWWWVTAPLWGGLAILCAIVFGGAAILGVVYGGAALIDAVDRWHRARRRAKRINKETTK